MQKSTVGTRQGKYIKLNPCNLDLNGQFSQNVNVCYLYSVITLILLQKPDFFYVCSTKC